MNALCKAGSHDWVFSASPDFMICNRIGCNAVERVFNAFDLGIDPGALVKQAKDINTMTKQATKATTPVTQATEATPAPKDFEENKTGYVNEIIISGRLAKPVEYRLLDSGREMAKVTMRALNPGNKQQDTLWFSLIMWHNPEKTDRAQVNTEAFKIFCLLPKGSDMVVTGRFSMYGQSPQVTIQHFSATPPNPKPAQYEDNENNGGYPNPDDF